MSGEKYAPPPGPPPGYQSQNSNASHSQAHVSWAQGGRSSEMASNNPFRNAHVNAPQDQLQSSSGAPPAYEAPPGPPPNWGDKKTPAGDEEYAPPPGPPPSHQHSHADEAEPPPYDPWLAVPDNALLPPPPSFRDETSPASNASWDDAARGREWCYRNPLWSPRRHNQQTLSRISNGDIRLTTPPNTRNVQISHPNKGRTRIRTHPKCTDTILLSDIPLYTATTGQPRTIYYELRVLSMGGVGSARNEEADASIAIGFLAPPYPSWRQPGWHRASLGIHGDDGRRFIDDSFGGKDFTSYFRKNDVVGIGMTFSPPGYGGGKSGRRVFFTRNGKRDGEWDLHEERDQEQDGGEVLGLEGQHDLLAAVGCFGGVEFEVLFRREEWKFRP